MDYYELKAKIIAIARQGLDREEEDITTGIEDNVYEDDEDNRNRLQQIATERKLIDEFEDYKQRDI